MGRKKINLLVKLLLGILLGILIGSLGGWFSIEYTLPFVSVIRLLKTFNALFGTFLNFLIPLIILSYVTVGLADLGKKANKLFGITLLLAYASTVFAGLLSFFSGEALLPWLVVHGSAAAESEAIYSPLFTIDAPPIFGVITALLLSFLFGIGMANIKGETLLEGFKDIKDILTKILGAVVIPLIPLHIAGMFAGIAAEGKLASTISTFAFLFGMILVLQLFYILSQYALASLISRTNQFPKLKNALPAYFTALGTQSSAATIPVALNCAYRNEVKKDVADFCIPLCATINLGGDTIALVVGTMGILLANGMQPSLAEYLPFILMLGVTMVAAPGVPGGGVMAALGLIASMLGFSPGMQELMITLHFAQDSFGTAANVTGDQALALMVDSFDHKKNHKKLL